MDEEKREKKEIEGGRRKKKKEGKGAYKIWKILIQMSSYKKIM